jgi:hypothetical protein
VMDIMGKVRCNDRTCVTDTPDTLPQTTVTKTSPIVSKNPPKKSVAALYSRR